MINARALTNALQSSLPGLRAAAQVIVYRAMVLSTERAYTSLGISRRQWFRLVKMVGKR